MARYTGPKSRIARKFGEGIFGADKVLSKKNYPPGQHGNSRKRKTSEYGVQLREKQKAKYTYGVLEKQFRNLFEKAATAKGITGEVLLQLLEGRLDNVVFRLGIAPTRAAARQLVSHKHITVDGLMIQNLSRELFSIADANEGKLKKRVVFYCDEFGTMPPFDVLPLFSAGRSRKLTLVPIIQSLAQLEKNYGKEGAEIIADNCQDTIFGGFAPNSQTAETLSKALGSRTVLTDRKSVV